jgi:hypothetical protein
MRLDPLMADSGPIGAVEGVRAGAMQSKVVAAELAQKLPANKNERRKLLEKGFAVAREMSWERVVEDMLLPVLRRLEE